MSGRADLLTGQGFQVPSVSKNLDLLTNPSSQEPSVSKKADLLTGQCFQRPLVSKNLDLLTKPIFQGSSVTKKADLLTGQGFQVPSVSKTSRSAGHSRKEKEAVSVDTASCADGETRTHTGQRPLPPQSSVSTISPHPQNYFGTAKVQIFLDSANFF